ncbi:MAG: peroxiredoxin [Planctomycetota bacterium]|nr:MAG: peroxiredoxin [Planctomycetota bacterium]
MAIAVGSPAPDFTLKDQDGRDWRLSEHRGKIVVLLWYPLDWSPTCTKENCGLAEDPGELRGEDVVLVGISRDSTWSHKAFKEHHRIPYDLLADPTLEVTRSYGLEHPKVPFISHRATVVIDRDGIVRFVQVQEQTGEPRDMEAVRRAVQELRQAA